MSEYSVQKFGGSSMSQPERVAELFMADPDRNRVAIVSAVGKDPARYDDHVKSTAMLLELEQAVDRSDTNAVRQLQEAFIEKNRSAFSSLGNKALNQVCDYAYDQLQPLRRADGYAWVGERIAAKLFAELSGAEYVPTDLRFSGGVLHLAESIRSIQQTILPILRSGKQVVSEGFFGYDLASGKVVTLPRGGSDTSAVVYTGALSKDNDHLWINENYTDKDGILSADPGIVPQPRARVISEMTHEEVREKMHGVTERNGVIHGNAIAYAAWMNVDIQVKNTFSPTSDGTHITSSRASDPEHPIIGISGKDDIMAIDVYDMGMADAENYMAPILARIGESRISLSNFPTGEDRVKFVINSGASEGDLEAVRDYIRQHSISGKDKATVEIIRNEGAVYLVGQELTKPVVYTKILGKTAILMANAGLSMRSVISHEKSPSLALTVEGSDVQEIIELLHQEFIES